MKKNQFFCLITLLLMVVSLQAQEINKLYIPDIRVGLGENAILPIHVENTSNSITGIQFTLKAEEGVIVDINNAAMTERLLNHIMNVDSRDNNTYVVMIHSSDNTLLSGNDGVIVNIPISLSNTVDISDIKSIELSKVVLSDNLGNNVITEFSSGRIMPIPTLTLKAGGNEIKEGQKIFFTISNEIKTTAPLEISISSDMPGRLRFPSTVTMEANSSTATFEVEAIDNGEVSDTLTASVKVSAMNHKDGEFLLLIIDDDMPDIEMDLTPVSVSESGGNEAIFGIIRKSNRFDSKITVNLSDDSNGRFFYSSEKLVLEKGVVEMPFTIGIVDNEIVEDEKKVNVTAAIYISSCDCSVSSTSNGSVTKAITILDDDGPTLKMVASTTSMQEGSTDNIITISRNTSTTENLTVILSSDYDEMLDYNHTVIIPAGHLSVQVKISVKENDILGDSKIVTFNASSEGYTMGTCWVKVSDLTFPDGKITSISLDNSEVESGAIVNVSVVITNDGVEVLPSQTPITFHLTSGKSTVDAYTQQEVLSGQSITMTKQLRMPDLVGTYELYAVLNEKHKVKELLYTNNASQKVEITLHPSFTVTATTDKDVYLQGETIHVTGRAEGKRSSNATIEVYFINEGLRTTVEATTDDEGSYTAEWTPLDTQSGHYSVGACFPRENLKTEMSSCDVYGLKRLKKTFLAHKILQGDNYEGTIDLINPGNLSLTGVEVVTIGGSAACQASFSLPNNIEANETIVLTYNLKGINPSTGNDWEIVTAKITTQEGITLEIPIRYYIEPQTSLLIASETDIKTTMTKGNTRDYIVTLTNKGKGETGRISIDLPNTPWLSLGTPASIPSLSQNDSTTIVFKLTPTENMQLNNVYNAKLGINYGNQGLAVNISAEAVSTVDGTLTIDVCDEATYYTDEAPHLKGATVTIQHPSSLAVLAEGTTGDDGTFTVTLHEGLYQVTVTAPYHCSYKNYIQVSPEMETRETVDLNTTALTYSITYEPTEIEDEYQMVTTLNYETSVPVPKVVTKLPSYIPCDELHAGESLIFNAILTNKGLITANETYLELPESQESLLFEPLIEGPFDLLAGQTITIPVKVTNTSDLNFNTRSTTRATIRLCHIQCTTYWHYRCGNRIIPERIIDKVVYREVCREEEVREGVIPRGGGGAGNGYGLYLPNGNVNPEYVRYDYVRTKSENCNGCWWQTLRKVAECGLGFVPNPYVSCGTGVVSATIDDFTGQQNFHTHTSAVLNGISCAASICAAAAIGATEVAVISAVGAEAAPVTITLAGICTVGGIAVNLLNCAISLSQPCNSQQSTRNRTTRQGSEVVPAFVDELRSKADVCRRHLQSYKDYMIEYFGDEEWLSSNNEQVFELIAYILDSKEENLIDKLLVLKPENISITQLENFIERFKNTTDLEKGLDIASDNYIDIAKLQTYSATLTETQKIFESSGFTGFADYWNAAISDFQEESENNKNSVCSSVTLEFKQKMAMTREAIRGILTVKNGSETNKLEDFKLNLKVYDPDGNLADSHIMQISTETMKGFEGEKDMQSGWTLAAGQEGVATILFIPTKYAAPTQSLSYTFAGTISYIDPYTGLEFTNDLSPVTMTINPSPDLDLTYFMQRDIWGDDALTEDIVESSVPAEFALLITNKGYGDAKKVKITTDQPTITENEKGLAVNFEMLSSSLNGEEKSLAMGQSTLTEFGDILAQSSSYAQWYLSCNLLGHFNGYKVEATHLTSYGNPDLSLIDNATIHELIHTLSIGNNKKPGWLVNDVVDSKDLPDKLYMTDGTVKAVAQASATLTDDGSNNYTLIVEATAAGWNYGNLIDPTNGHKVLKSITRNSDGTAISLNNFWQTDRTLRDGKDPLYEYRLHFADEMAATGETYTLTFEDKPLTILDIDTIVGVSEEDGIISHPAEKVVVLFNKEVAASTFSSEDIQLTCAGEKVDVSQMEITKQDEKSFELNLQGFTNADGYYVLTIQTAGIKDSEGFAGEYGRQISWTQMVPQTIKLEYNVPEGWNWISSSLMEENVTDTKSFLEPIKDQVSRLVGFENELINDPVYGFVGKLTTIRPENGYKLHVKGSTQFSYSGLASEPAAYSINLKEGWNWIGYLPVNPLPVQEAMKNHSPMENDILKGQDAFVTYADGVWTGTLAEMKPGEGYMYYSGKNVSFKYPKVYASSMASRNASTRAFMDEANPWQYDVHKYADNAVLIGKLYVDDKHDVEGDHVVGAFSGNECRGVGKNINGLVYMVIHGDINDSQMITFRTYNTITGIERAIQESIVFGGQSVGNVNNPQKFNVKSTTGISSIEGGFYISPRPLKNTLYISGNTSEIKSVQILSTSGKTMLKSVGYDQSGIDVGMLLPSMYIVTITTNDGKVYYEKVFKN